MLTDRTVIDAFRLILGREPESESVIAFHRGMPSEAALRRALLGSAEFARLYARQEAEALLGKAAAALPEAGDAPVHADERPGTHGLLLARGILPPEGRIETAAAPEAIAALWARTGASWTEFGATAPHWSVLTHDAFRPERLEENRDAFEESAEVEGVLVDAALERAPDRDPAGMRCLEIGCGVGRATRALARRFAHVTAVDISPTHIAVAERELAAAGIANVTLSVVGGPDDYAAAAAGRDFLFTRLVLQHNPPPVQEAILATVFAGLAPGAVALFQVVTYGRRYGYDTAADLAGQGGGMEMHVLPQHRVFALMERAGIAPLEVQEDFAAGREGPWRSHLFLGRKR
jgi:SAM-dependent methyltransferase